MRNTGGPHQPAKGQKLVGSSLLGTTKQDSYTQTVYPIFDFANYDCVGEITITRISIIKNQLDLGTPPELIYEGPYINIWKEGVDKRSPSTLHTGEGRHREILTRPLMPHESGTIELIHYMYTGAGADPRDLTNNDNWLLGPHAMARDLARYTLEIEWEAEKDVCPLSGVGTIYHIYTRLVGSDAGKTYRYPVGFAMNNFIQFVKSKSK